MANITAYGLGTMGYTKPNIHRIGFEGIRFTDPAEPVPAVQGGYFALLT